MIQVKHKKISIISEYITFATKRMNIEAYFRTGPATLCDIVLNLDITTLIHFDAISILKKYNFNLMST